MVLRSKAPAPVAVTAALTYVIPRAALVENCAVFAAASHSVHTHSSASVTGSPGCTSTTSTVPPKPAVEPWLSELSELSDTIGLLSDRYRNNSQIVSIGTFGQLSELSDSIQGGHTFVHYRTYYRTIGAIGLLSDCYRTFLSDYRTRALVARLPAAIGVSI